MLEKTPTTRGVAAVVGKASPAPARLNIWWATSYCWKQQYMQKGPCCWKLHSWSPGEQREFPMAPLNSWDVPLEIFLRIFPFAWHPDMDIERYFPIVGQHFLIMPIENITLPREQALQLLHYNKIISIENISFDVPHQNCLQFHHLSP